MAGFSSCSPRSQIAHPSRLDSVAHLWYYARMNNRQRAEATKRCYAIRFGKWLRRRREAEALSRAELAVRAGVSTGAVELWEQGKRMPKTPQLHALARVLGEGVWEAVKEAFDRDTPSKGTGAG